MDIMAVGGYGTGLSLFVERAPEPGETVADAKLVITPGGKGSNQAVAAARLGATTGLITAIGRDGAGRTGRALWRAEGIDTSGVLNLDGETMLGAIVTDATGENRIVVADGVLAELGASHVESMLGNNGAPRIILVSCEVTLGAIRAALSAGRTAGAVTILNPAPVPALTPADWANIDIVTPNRTEAHVLLGHATGAASPEETARELSTRYDVTVVMTLGADGAVAWPKDGDTAIQVPAFAAGGVIDTTGAGDALNGAVAAGLAAGLDLSDAVHLGTVCGGLAVTRRGVIPALPTLAEASAALNAAGRGRIADFLAPAARQVGHHTSPSPRKGQP
ncbi:MAG: ribokinase [Bifidobacteriaceae bacterium]|jgi:ribokinase|nr:ribokinase [Bifidobacteriaceae bacterium]